MLKCITLDGRIVMESKIEFLIKEFTEEALTKTKDIWGLSRLHRLGKDFDKDLLDRLLSNTKHYPSFSNFRKSYKLLYEVEDKAECHHEAVTRVIQALFLYDKPHYFEKREQLINAIAKSNHQQTLQNKREEEGLLGKIVPKGKRDGKKSKVDYSVWTVKKK
jgi:hypothetical protein